MRCLVWLALVPFAVGCALPMPSTRRSMMRSTHPCVQVAERGPFRQFHIGPLPLTTNEVADIMKLTPASPEAERARRWHKAQVAVAATGTISFFLAGSALGMAAVARSDE